MSNATPQHQLQLQQVALALRAEDFPITGPPVPTREAASLVYSGSLLPHISVGHGLIEALVARVGLGGSLDRDLCGALQP